jgi:hypothetical protein
MSYDSIQDNTHVNGAAYNSQYQYIYIYIYIYVYVIYIYIYTMPTSPQASPTLSNVRIKYRYRYVPLPADCPSYWYHIATPNTSSLPDAPVHEWRNCLVIRATPSPANKYLLSTIPPLLQI